MKKWLIKIYPPVFPDNPMSYGKAKLYNPGGQLVTTGWAHPNDSKESLIDRFRDHLPPAFDPADLEIEHLTAQETEV